MLLSHTNTYFLSLLSYVTNYNQSDVCHYYMNPQFFLNNYGKMCMFAWGILALLMLLL